MKRIFTSIALVSLAVVTFAGGLLTNTNQSASFVRNPMRYASLETDAIYFNPAGTAFFNDGWSFSANWQMIWQDRDVYNPGKDGQEFKGSVYVPCMPTLFAAYKTGDWTFSGFFGMPGGGGNAQFEDGLPLFNNLGNGFKSLVPLFNMGGNATGNAYSEFESTQYLFALQLGAAYRINDNLSVYGGLRTNYTSLSYEGAISIPTANNAVTPLSLELKQSGIAFAPIIGIDYKVGKFNFAVKYEFRAVNTIENETDALNIFGINANKSFNGAVDAVRNNYTALAIAQVMQGYGVSQEVAAGIVANDATTQATINGTATAAGQAFGQLASLQDGEKFRNDAPAKLSLGASWDITDRVKIMGGYTYYFDKDAKIESLLTKANTMKTLSRNTYEILAGVEYKLTDKWLLSTGLQFSDFGVNPSYLSDISFIDDSFMVGAGAKYSINDKWDLNFGACYANYAPGTSNTGSYYKRKTYNVSVGVDFRL